MADLVAIANGNLTAAATWGVVDNTSKLISTSVSQSTLTVAAQDSTTFIPGAITVAGIVVKLTARAAGAPTNTITVTLRNTTAGTDAASVTANVSDLPFTTTGVDNEGGFHYFKFSAPVLLVAGNSYAVRMLLSATTTVVSMGTNGTAANWVRMLVTTTTQTPIAGDDMHLAQTLDGATNPATVVARTVSMDSTAATDYGSAVVSNYVGALTISKACTFTYLTTAATNFILRLSGTLIVFAGGSFKMGDTGAEIPRNSTAVLEFDNGADGQFGIRLLASSSFTAFGLSRTVGKNQWMALQTADAIATATTVNIDTDTGWLAGDEVIMPSTSRIRTETDLRVLNANAGASSFVTTVGLTNGHLGSGDYICEVFLLTRNVEIRSVSSTFMGYVDFLSTSVSVFEWMRFRYMGSPTHAFNIITTTGSVSFTFCVFRDFDNGLTASGASTGNWTFNKCLIYNILSATAILILAATTGTWTITDVAIIACVNAMNIVDVGGTIGNLWLASNSTSGITWNQAARLNDGTGGPTFSVGAVWKAHSNGGGTGNTILNIASIITDLTFPVFNFWKNDCAGPIRLNSGVSASNIEFTGNFFSNGVAASQETGCFTAQGENAISDMRFINCNISGDTVFQANWGCLFDKNNISAAEILWDNCKFSENTGTRRPLLVADIGVIPDVNSGGMLLQGVADNCTFGAPEPIKFFLATGPNPRLASKYAYVLCPNYNQVLGAHRTYGAWGTIILDTTTFDVTPSQNIKPIAGLTLAVDSNTFRRNTGFLVPVNSGGTVTVSVKVQIDVTYNGSTMPQLVLLKNVAAGIAADVIIDTHNGTPSVFDTLTGTTAAVTANGVLEFVIRCYGTAGNVWVDTWSTASPGQDSTGDKYWETGMPVTVSNTTGGGGGGGGEHSNVF